MPIRRSLAAIALLATGCGPLQRGSSEPPALVIFENHSTEQVDVYAVRSAGDRKRLGTVFATRTDTLRLPASFLNGDGNVTIVARILAGARAPGSGVFGLRSGDQVIVSLPPAANILNVLGRP